MSALVKLLLGIAAGATIYAVYRAKPWTLSPPVWPRTRDVFGGMSAPAWPDKGAR